MQPKLTEWSDSKAFNPFNSMKLMSQVYKWRQIEQGKPLPPPTTISIDPTNVCNLSCTFCNSRYERSHNANSIQAWTLYELGHQLKDWGVETVCIGGGGEPTTHKGLDFLIGGLSDFDVKAGMVTNGTNLDQPFNYKALEWLGVSVNAGTRETYTQLHRRDHFDKVIKNIANLNAKLTDGRLTLPGQGHGISYKYLLQPQNVGEVSEAAKIARDIGARNLHIRPVANPWDRSLGSAFTQEHIDTFRAQLDKAREYETDTFGIFGVTHKFDGNFQPKNEFPACYAIFMTGVIQPPTTKDSLGFNFGSCCDRRGDPKMTLEDLTSVQQIRDFWGSDKHWELYKSIKPKDCPRCTYSPHNKIMENVVLRENTTYDFI